MDENGISSIDGLKIFRISTYKNIYPFTKDALNKEKCCSICLKLWHLKSPKCHVKCPITNLFLRKHFSSLSRCLKSSFQKTHAKNKAMPIMLKNTYPKHFTANYFIDSENNNFNEGHGNQLQWAGGTNHHSKRDQN